MDKRKKERICPIWWSVSKDGFKSIGTVCQTLSVFNETLRWLNAYSNDYGILLSRSEIVSDQFTIRFCFDSSKVDKDGNNNVMEYLTTVCASLHDFRSDSRTKILVTKRDCLNHDVFDVEFSLYFQLPF